MICLTNSKTRKRVTLMPIKFDTTTRTPLTEGGEGYIYEYNGKIIKTFKQHIDRKSVV